MALIKPEQLRSGSYNITGSFTGSFYGNGSNIVGVVSASYATSASYAISASYEINYETSSSYAETASIAYTASYVSSSNINGVILSASYALTASYSLNGGGGGSIDTGSFATTGSNTFIGDQTIDGENIGLIVDASGLRRVGFMKYGGLEGSIARISTQDFRILRTTGSNINDGTNAITDFYIAGDGKVGIGTTSPAYTLDVSGSSNFTDGQTIVGNITFPSGSFISSTNISGNIYISTLNDGILHLNDDGGEGDVWMLNGQNKLRIEGDTIITGSIHQSGIFYPNQIDWFSSSIGYDTGSYILTTTNNGLTVYANYQDVANGLTPYISTVSTSISASYADIANSVNDLNQNVFVSGTLTVLGGATFYGSSSFVYITASQLDVSASFISVNVFEPIERFGGLKVYDSGSSTATASLAWDSLHNHWVYENVDGATYTGGMLLSGPRNTGSLGDEPNLTKWFVPRGDGGDHLNDSQIFTSASITQITGSLTVTGTISGSFVGDGSQLTGISYERLSDFQSPYHYSGNATLGTSTSSTGWIINRIDFTTPGSPITLQGTGSWDNRTSLIYS
jgi:hypothetical protein